MYELLLHGHLFKVITHGIAKDIENYLFMRV